MQQYQILNPELMRRLGSEPFHSLSVAFNYCQVAVHKFFSVVMVGVSPDIVGEVDGTGAWIVAGRWEVRMVIVRYMGLVFGEESFYWSALRCGSINEGP